MENDTLNSSETSEEPIIPESEIVSESEQDQTEQDPKAEDTKPDHKNTRVEKRFARLTKTLSQKDQELESLKQELESFRKSAKPEVKQESKPIVESSNKPNPDDFASYNEYIEALTDFKFEQKLKEKEVQTTLSNRQEKYNQKVESFKQISPDFSEVIQDVLPVIGNDSEIIEFLIDSDNGPAILYKLAQDDELLEKYEKASKFKKASILAKLEDEIVTSVPVKKVEKQKVVPPKPVSRVSTASTPSQTVPDENSSFSEWKKYRLSQKKK